MEKQQRMKKYGSGEGELQNTSTSTQDPKSINIIETHILLTETQFKMYVRISLYCLLNTQLSVEFLHQ